MSDEEEKKEQNPEEQNPDPRKKGREEIGREENQLPRGKEHWIGEGKDNIDRRRKGGEILHPPEDLDQDKGGDDSGGGKDRTSSSGEDSE